MDLVTVELDAAGSYVVSLNQAGKESIGVIFPADLMPWLNALRELLREKGVTA